MTEDYDEGEKDESEKAVPRKESEFMSFDQHFRMSEKRKYTNFDD